ncbi:hypothetical protein C8R44DRAFT_741399 [Mycena epipterygia]|nr:hypothetical protein C8R44DRAFT_741399 [Mycena epipterygia]
MERLVKLSKEPGFSASILPGVSVDKSRRVPGQSPQLDPDVDMPDAQTPPRPPATATPPLEEDEDDEGDVDVDVLADAFEHILSVAHDACAFLRPAGTCAAALGADLMALIAVDRAPVAMPSLMATCY